MLENQLHEQINLKYTIDIVEKAFRSFSKTVFIKFYDEDNKPLEEIKLGYLSPEEVYAWIDEGKDLNLNNVYIKNFSLLDYKVERGMDDSVMVKLNNLSAKKTFFDCDLKTDFSYAEFIGEKTVFEQAVFCNGISDFNHSNFGLGDALFKKAKFGSGTINFQFASFGEGLVNFNGCNFGHGNVLFVSTDFGKGNVDYKNTIWGNGNVDFKFAKFSDGDVTFEKAQFGKGKKDFKNLEFGGGKIDFRRVSFNDGDVSFEGVEFGKGKVMFRSAGFGHGEKSFDEADFGLGEAQFDQVDFGSGKLSFHMVKADELSFHGCGLNLFVDMRLSKCNLIDLSNTIIRDIIDFEPEDEEIHIKTINFRGMRILGRLFIDYRVNKVNELIYSQDETTTMFQKAEQFRLLKENFRNNGQYEDEDSAYIEFKRCESKAILEEDLKKGKKDAATGYVSYYFQRFVFDEVGRYGTAPTRVLVNMILAFTVFSLMYFVFSISETLTSLGHVVAGGAETKYLKDLPVLEAFGNSLYYSGITFFTVGYGDYFATGLLKPIAVFEGFCGVFLMSYFTVAFVRKILR